MKHKVSISLRLTLWFSAAFMLGYLIFGVAMYLQLSFSLAAGRDKTLSRRAERAAALLRTCHVGNTICEAKYDDFAAATPEGNLIHVFNQNGTRLYPVATSPDDIFPWPTAAALQEQEFSKVQYQGASFRMLSQIVLLGGQRYRIVVGGQLRDNRALVAQFRRGLLWAVPVFLVFSAAFGYFLSTRALNPVGELIASFRSTSIGNLSRRLPTLHSGDELEALTETCNEMLARLDTAVSQITRFTADASHELRSPITYIYTLAECALRNSSLDEESTESFQEIVKECKEATELLDDMLTLARCDSGHTGMVFAPTDLLEILEDVAAKAGPIADRKQHRLITDFNRHDPVWIMGDASSLRRLFWIMLDNAIKYTPATGQITMRLQVSSGEARIAIQDTGVGIPHDSLPHVFDRFYRVDKARTFSEGTGLGLSIAKWISDIHRAVISVESTENAGSTFQIAFGTINARI
ncbi:sensor histidine kinase [Terriglobus albidus]|uniref:sensor histidine kinase n=1 Tax=Terriglobus albidus TaxID=1592106 RepID=UPI0021E09EC8|nr:ATP-binding protein [Terriglobus albidus]